jgi:hypothetical protein
MVKWKATKKPTKCSIIESFLCVFHFRDVNKGCKKINEKSSDEFCIQRKKVINRKIVRDPQKLNLLNCTLIK